MVGWRRHMQSIILRVGKRVEHNCNASVSTSFYHSKSSSINGHFQFMHSLCGSSSANSARPLYNYLQHMGFTSSRILLANSSDATPVPSPLTPQLALTSGKAEAQQAVSSKPSTVQAVLKNIKQAQMSSSLVEGQRLVGQQKTFQRNLYQSPKKVNLVAALVRGMRVEDALLQLQVTVKRASKTVYQVIHSARANATHNHGLDPDRLLIAEAYVGKGFFKKRIKYHGKGKCGIMVRPECRLTVVVREITPEEEAKIAKLRVSNFLKLSKRERRLVPHKLIETTPIWDRKGKVKDRGEGSMAS